MNIRILLTGSAIALGAAMTATPASAQFRCDLNGVAGVPLAAQGANSVVCGIPIAAPGTSDDLTVLGIDVAFSGDGVTLIGANAIAQTNSGIPFIANYARPEGFGVTAVGAYSIVTGAASVAVGDRATVGLIDFSTGFSPISNTAGGTAIGSYSLVTGNFGTAIGLAAQANGVISTAVGSLAIARADAATAVGNNSQALGVESVAVGHGAMATGSGGLAIGSLANASATGGSSVGLVVPGVNLAAAMAIGYASQAFGADTTVVGNYALIGNIGDSVTVYNGATAIGAASRVGAANATTIGARATATAANSVAIGYGSVANQANTVSVGTAGGERKIVNLAAGTAPTDAVNVSQLNAATSSFNAGLAAAQGDIDNLYSMQRRDRRDMKQGVAAAVAIANSPLPSGPGKVSYAVNGAMFRGEYAIGGSMNYRLNTDAPLAIGIGVSHGGGKNTAVRVGVAGEF
ncbi:MAG: hypothetical protein ABIR87_05925 [Sphingomicrobium sp.]